jgi:hypothetical protein
MGWSDKPGSSNTGALRLTQVNIIGVDFSGARLDQNTWLARGWLDGEVLVLSECRPVTRSQLTGLLADATGPAVAALDFPFAVPREFARFWQPDAATMPDLWADASGMDFSQFLALRNQFVACHGEPKRLADTYFPECYSCLHLANPNMVPMTFRGMQMLHQLWLTGCAVPPLPASLEASEAPTVLLEAMPGAALRAFGLPYKGYKKGMRALQLRRAILDGLADSSSVKVQGLSPFLELCLNNHDCLDSVVAAVVAALWARDPGLFRCPLQEGNPDFDPAVMLEGWLYAPVYVNRPAGHRQSTTPV